MKLVLLVAIFANSAFTHKFPFTYKFPENFHTCHVTDPQLDNCLKITIENALRLIGSTGIPSLYLRAIDPLKVTKIEIGAGTNAVNLVQKYSDVSLHGIASSKVENAHLDIDRKVLTFEIFIPSLTQEAHYDINGSILVVPVYGNGKSVQKLFNVTVISTITFEEETKNGESYFKVQSYKLSIDPRKGEYRFDNMFDGDERLGATILKTLNDNWKAIYDDIRSGLEGAYAAVFKSITNGFFSKIPNGEIFLK
ncbi:hypothetical protein NQ315_007833 [Exocentrus adspersus]|uniref:Uncharacterized protein n=1 Tax=Exocentrus adspersus TaxID=1586481 RepID=A0AAV8W8L9_9CUCU|nr:hypothetical protein NQ315_007833 [Exocentrus adspersus]